MFPPITEVVRGSLIERYRRCGKPNCHCVKGEGHHSWYLTTSFGRGKTEQVTVPEKLVPYVAQWIENYNSWWDSVEKISKINRELLRRRWIKNK